MSGPAFVIGQRYISSTEIELGLGIVSQLGNRRITITFPAAAEERTYAIDSTPLTRIIFSVGDSVTIRDGQTVTVSDVDHTTPLTIYSASVNGAMKQFSELELSDHIQFSGPLDRLFSGQLDSNKTFRLRQQTLGFMNKLRQTDVAGLLGPRVQLLPHQIYIAHEVASQLTPRVLLADEVGLGKTIEAGLILHRLLITERAQRCLILVPESLIHQWLVEMLRRFNLNASIIDDEAFTDTVSNREENPYEQVQLAISSVDLMARSDTAYACARTTQWDVLIIDEVHRIEHCEDSAGESYRRIESLASEIPGLLLLTATPEQFGSENHFAQLKLLDPDRFHNFKEYQQQQTQFEQLAELIEKLTTVGSDADIEKAEKLLELDYSDDHLDPDQLAHRLLDYYGTGRVLFRNTRDNVSGFPARRLQDHQLPAPAKYLEAIAQTSIQQQLQPELILKEQWLQLDARVKWLIDWLQKEKPEKVLLICANANTASELEKHLTLRCAVKATCFYEGLTLVARDRAAAYFAEPNGAQVLVCSEIGSEGRNFQFCHHLVLFDLPLNPDTLEQRIGRLDRIGQTQEIMIHVPYYQDSAMEVLLRWYNESLDIFTQVCSSGSFVYRAVSDRLEQILTSKNHDEIESFITDSALIYKDIQARLSLGRNRLIEYNSLNQQTANQVIDDIYQYSLYSTIRDYAELLLDYFGYEITDHDHQNIIVRTGSEMIAQPYSRLPEDGITATFQREIALTREDLHYLSWEHPLIQACMDTLVSEHLGSATVSTLKLKPLRAGTILVETVFRFVSQAPTYLSLDRFIESTELRLLLDESGNELGKIIQMDHLDRLVKPVNRHTAHKIIQSAKDKISKTLDNSQTLAASFQKEVISHAEQKINQLYEKETQRLKMMSDRNPNISEKDLDILSTNWQRSLSHIHQATFHLDSVRLCLVTE